MGTLAELQVYIQVHLRVMGILWKGVLVRGMPRSQLSSGFFMVMCQVCLLPSSSAMTRPERSIGIQPPEAQ